MLNRTDNKLIKISTGYKYTIGYGIRSKFDISILFLSLFIFNNKYSSLGIEFIKCEVLNDKTWFNILIQK